MSLYRKTAIVELELPSGATEGSLPLTCERQFGVLLTVDGKRCPAQHFCSPINDEQWREFIRQLRDCNTIHDKTGYRGATAIRTLGRTLYLALAELSPVLREFLDRTSVPRRLVIQTTRPELHLLPWAALYDEQGQLLAAGDLSVVQSWEDFNEVAIATGSRLRLKQLLGADTNQMTAPALDHLPAEISEIAFDDNSGIIDILHLEEHGDAASTEVGGVRATALATTFSQAKIALLWSCYSGAANSWGESPALCLHREGAGLVLSFLAELHNLDAKSIAESFYGDVFGPAASRDPESALVRIRCAKFKTEFEYANWASMTVYLRSPLDLSALPLNGPRVPEAGWNKEDPSGLWVEVGKTVGQLQPGTMNEFDAASESIQTAPAAAFLAWRGNVILLDGRDNPLRDDVITELNLVKESAPKTDAADKLVWFLGQIATYGSPLIVWTNAAPRHLEFLKTIQPSSTLTFLLLYGPEITPTVAQLVAENRLEEARNACAALKPDCDDEQLSAAYYAFARCEKLDESLNYLKLIQGYAERSLMSGNFISRFKRKPEEPELELTDLEQRRFQEDCYRRAMAAPGADVSGSDVPAPDSPERDIADSSLPLREFGRAKHELGYMLQGHGKTGAAEMLYRLGLGDLEQSSERDTRWHSALGNVLRDWADLLAGTPERLSEASALLRRAMAIHAFHGRRLQTAYALVTAAHIALTGCHHTAAIEHAVNAANRFEECQNWRGWEEAASVLFDCLAETRETKRMLSLADLAVEKIRRSNLREDKRVELQRKVTFEKSRAHWIAGELDETRAELKEWREGYGSDGQETEQSREVERLWTFLSLKSLGQEE